MVQRPERPKKARLTASTADKHRLYEQSVQDPTHEIAFIDRVFQRAHKRRPRTLREDFCGTGLLCREWVESGKERSATGVDLDADVLAWSERNNRAPLGRAAERLRLLRQDVLAGTSETFDVVVALNFSYWIFKDRERLRAYFARALEGVGKDGLFILDAYGGLEAQDILTEERQVAGFKYIWDQAEFNPIDHAVTNHIHFEFRDGTRLDRAFTYEWRFWSLPELQELLREAGFREVEVHWDVAADDDSSVYRVRKKAANQPGWLAFITARR